MPVYSRHCDGQNLTGVLVCRMGQLSTPKAEEYIHRAIVQAIADAKAEVAPCKQPPREELPQDLVEMLSGYKQVRIAACCTNFTSTSGASITVRRKC